jgi:coenzyme F420-0:L-glutamate ligase / coenzyme F420-1:gamma-L-glutamate ligase
MEVIALPGVPEVGQGDDLPALLLDAYRRAGLQPGDGDVVCVAQKVVSKVEGAVVTVGDDEEVAQARRRLAREHAVRIVADTPEVLIVETHHGLVCANGGIDASNAEDRTLILLPDDPDASAHRIVDAVSARTGARIAVVITDTFGRPWRLGQTDVAIGVAGMAPLRDERGGRDRTGRVLEATLIAVADEVAAAADLVRRKADGTPFILVRGAAVDAADPGPGARALVRPAREDLFRRSQGPDRMG